jgi:putative intracellular protease/amidase
MTHDPASAAVVIVFAIFDDLTQLDFTGPWEVLSRLPNAQVVVASKDGGEVRAQGGLTFAHVDKLSRIPTCDVLCVPGGPGTSPAMLDEGFLAEIRRLAENAQFITSVCTGSLVLGAAGLLAGKRATSHWSSLELLTDFGAQPIRERVVRDGRVITGGGVTAGIDFGLAVAAELAGEERAQFIQLALEYNPDPPFAAGDPWTAPEQRRRAYRSSTETMMAERRRAVGKVTERMKQDV